MPFSPPTAYPPSLPIGSDIDSDEVLVAFFDFLIQKVAFVKSRESLRAIQAKLVAESYDLESIREILPER